MRKRKFAGVSYIEDLDMGSYFGLSGWAQCNQKGTYWREVKSVRVRKVGQREMERGRGKREIDLKMLCC
jgi:hypothetical protein